MILKKTTVLVSVLCMIQRQLLYHLVPVCSNLSVTLTPEKIQQGLTFFKVSKHYKILCSQIYKNV